jgi:two-component system sensor histidine kinase/response regulator
MNNVIGMTDLLLDAELTPEQAEYLQMVRISADSLLTIINHILDFSRIEAGKLQMDAVAFDLRRNLEEVTKGLAIKTHRKGLEFLVKIHPECQRRS